MKRNAELIHRVFQVEAETLRVMKVNEVNKTKIAKEIAEGNEPTKYVEEKPKRVSYGQLGHWIMESWDEITVDCIKNCFIRSGICEGEPTLDDQDVHEVSDIEMINNSDSDTVVMSWEIWSIT